MDASMSTVLLSATMASKRDTETLSVSSPSPGSVKPIRKTPPPPKLNLDDCKPIVSTTTTNTSTNTSSNSSTAFVFTSSRTLRSLHGRTQSPNDVQQHSHLTPELVQTPGSRTPSTSPTTPSPITPGHHVAFGKHGLTQALLSRHSLGAVDARYIVSSNMRAAGFVPLAYAPHVQTRSPVTPSSASPVPTPADPPPFPPIFFVNPTTATTVPMWDYQRDLDYTLSKAPSRSASSVRSVSTPPSEHAIVPAKLSVLSPGVASDVSSPMASSSSSMRLSSPDSQDSAQPSIFSVLSAMSSQTSVSSMASPVPRGKERATDMEHSADSSVDGYPFPTTPVRAASEIVSNSPSTAGSTASGSVTPLAPSPSSSSGSLPRSTPSMSGSSSSGSGSLLPLPLRTPAARRPKTFASKRKETRESSASRSGLSLTELCSFSPRAWVSDVEMLPPVVVRRDSVRGRSRTTSTRIVSGRAAADAKSERSEVQPIAEAAQEVALLEAPAEIEEEVTAKVEELTLAEARMEVKEPSTKVAPLLPPVELDSEPADEVQLEKEKNKELERHRGREKDRDREKDRRRQKGKAKKSSSHSSSEPSTGTTPSPTREGKQKDKDHSSRKGTGKDRTRSTKEKGLGYTCSAYSSFSFPPRTDKGGASRHAHTLGDLDELMERKRAREAGEQAKGLVLAHLERDREHARQTEQWLAEKDVRTHKKRLSAGLASPPSFATAHGPTRGRGRGLGRGEHHSVRGRSVGAMSVISDAETMVQDPLDTIEARIDDEEVPAA